MHSQKELLRNYFASHPELQECGMEVDDGYSGSNFNRPGIQKILKLAGKEIDCIVVKDFSRFGRNLIEVGNYLDQVFPFLVFDLLRSTIIMTVKKTLVVPLDLMYH